MPTVIKRCISLLLILMLVVSLIPNVYAAETDDEADPAASTETREETTNTEPEENMIPPPNETEPPVTEKCGTEPSEPDIIDDSEPPIMLLIDGEVALASISNCQATTWATIWVNTDEYSPIAGKTNRFIYYEFAGKSRNRNNVGLKAIKVNGTWQAAYCLEPGIAEGSTYTEEDLTMDEFVSSSAAPSTLTVQQMKAMCVAVMYGQRTLPQSYLGKQTIDMNTYGKSSGRSGNYSTNWQITGRELLDAAEVRMLDNRYALLFIRGEMPIMDEKYDLLNHPNVKFTPEKGGAPYVHGGTELSVGSLSLSTVSNTETRFINLSEIEFELLSDEEIEAELLSGGNNNEEHH